MADYNWFAPCGAEGAAISEISCCFWVLIVRKMRSADIESFLYEKQRSRFTPLHDNWWWQEFLRGSLYWDGNHQGELYPCFPRLRTSRRLWIAVFVCFVIFFPSKPTKRNGMATDGRRISLCCCHAAAEDPEKDGFYEITPILMQCNVT